MSGTVFYKEGVSWCPASWAYKALLTPVMNDLDSRNRHDLGQQILEGLPPRMEFVDLSGWGEKDLMTLLESVRRVYSQFKNKGPEGWRSVDFYNGFLESVMELQDLLKRIANCQE